MITMKEPTAQARLEYIANCELGECPLSSPEPAALMLQDADPTAAGVVIANSAMAFAAGIAGDVKQDMIDAFLFATLVANASVTDTSGSKEWFSKYIEVLMFLGLTPGNIKYYNDQTAGHNLEMDKIVLEMIAAGLAAAALPATAVMLAVANSMINTLRKDDKPLRVFDSNAVNKDGANFTIGTCHQGDDGFVSVVLGTIAARSNQRMERVLFVQWSSADVQIYGGSYYVRFNHEHYKTVKETVKNKLTADSIRNIEAFSIA